jgi:hypothetical protein
MNIKVIILLIGLFLFTLGFINSYKPEVDRRNIYKILPRNVYDDVFLSLPSSEYNNNVYDSINSTYILNNENNYGSLYNKPVKRCEDTTSEGCEINYDEYIPDTNNLRNLEENVLFDDLYDKYQWLFIKNRRIKNRRLTSNYIL